MTSFRGHIIRTALLPGILPRLKSLLTDGFGQTAFLIAQIFAMARLLPPGHPYLNPANTNRFGIHHVMAQAANNLVLKRKNADQILVYVTVIFGLVLAAMQIGLVIWSLTLSPALVLAQDSSGGSATTTTASTADFTSIVLTKYKHAPAGGTTQDIAMILMDRVFGVPGIFNSCVSDTAEPCRNMAGDPVYTSPAFPTGFQKALHKMLQFYSLGMFAISALLITYYVITITAETAATGVPFGQRANKTWVIPRLILFSALLIPLNVGSAGGGLNAAQLTTLWSAKFGSNLATNGWALFNKTLNDAKGPMIEGMISNPKTPELDDLTHAIMVAKACQVAENALNWPAPKSEGDERYGVHAYLVRPPGANQIYTSASEYQTTTPPRMPTPPPPGEKSWSGSNTIVMKGTSYEQALRFVNYGNITIRFGVYDEEKYADETGNVMPRCGEITFNNEAMDGATGVFKDGNPLQSIYYDLINSEFHESATLSSYITCLVDANSQKIQIEPPCAPPDSKTVIPSLRDTYKAYVDAKKPTILADLDTNVETNVNNTLLDRGWAGAALWYNRIAEINGLVTSAVMNIPKATKNPYVLEKLAEQHMASAQSVTPEQIYSTRIPDAEMNILVPNEAEITAILSSVHKIITGSDTYISRDRIIGDNVALNTMNVIFGTSGLFEMRSNADTHPLAQLTAMGKGLMEASIRNIFIGFTGQGLSVIFRSQGMQNVKALTASVKAMGVMLLTMGFLLCYMLPILPFLYFFFAVSAWIRSIFEAIVAMPLWAMAHLRIDGEGLPGKAGANGYFLIMEIFLRPIMILLGLLAAITLFSAEVKILNEIYDLTLANIGGVDFTTTEVDALNEDLSRYTGAIDTFFFTAVYVIIVYMMAQSSFKLIDAIPNAIMRWGGIGVKTFQETSGDQAGSIMSSTYRGGKLLTGQLQGGQLALLA